MFVLAVSWFGSLLEIAERVAKHRLSIWFCLMNVPFVLLPVAITVLLVRWYHLEPFVAVTPIGIVYRDFWCRLQTIPWQDVAHVRVLPHRFGRIGVVRTMSPALAMKSKKREISIWCWGERPEGAASLVTAVQEGKRRFEKRD